MHNLDTDTVKAFGDEWSRFRQDQLSDAEHEEIFNRYFGIFPWASLAPDARGFDMGCGSGRWARKVAPRVSLLTCIDPSAPALDVARSVMVDNPNVVFINAGVSNSGLPPDSQDFGYSLGVLHHIPDTQEALRSCVRLLRPGAPFLLYLYYRFDNRPAWFRALWKITDVLRRGISALPSGPKNLVTDLIALSVYLPLCRLASQGEKLGFNVENWPLSSYRNNSFYTLRTDSRDRFGTPLEQRFTRREIQSMMENCDLSNISFSESVPYWCAVGYRRS